jgi:hypothetical protein
MAEHLVSDAIKKSQEEVLIVKLIHALKLFMTATDSLPRTDMLYDARIEAREILKALVKENG